MLKKEFFGDGKDFSALTEAEEWLEANNYIYGFLQNSSPRAIYSKNITNYVAKWRNLFDKEKDNACGRMLFPNHSPRNGPVLILLKETAEDIFPPNDYE